MSENRRVASSPACEFGLAVARPLAPNLESEPDPVFGLDPSLYLDLVPDPEMEHLWVLRQEF
ncbi:MAG: hypothetical protein A3I78_07465 [Gammaproteobacteria bacterium RIFCSPLOWO2_02_FULL_56_15]|nr:MAG: hypothetical protein A3I78_07465 [Gammaproteobacteria bacterium RIFCSPLOWO2_02_FULL_56_15]